MATAVQMATSTMGWVPYKLISANTTNSTLVKSTAGKVGSLVVGNTGAGVAFLKLYDKETAPVVGTDVPKHVINVPAASCVVVALNHGGLVFAAGIGFGVTGGVADADTTAVAANQVTVNIGYR